MRGPRYPMSKPKRKPLIKNLVNDLLGWLVKANSRLSMLTGVQMLVGRGLKLSLVGTPDVGVFTTTGAT